MKVSDMTGTALDWAVAKCEVGAEFIGDIDDPHFYSTDWSQGGVIIEREIAKIERFSDALWEATAFTNNAQDFVQTGSTPLIAAMRCYVASKLGEDIDLPEELQ